MAIAWLNHAKADPDLGPLRDDPRFKAMVGAAEARLAAAQWRAPHRGRDSAGLPISQVYLRWHRGRATY